MEKTIQTYKTKSFNHEGVTGMKDKMRLGEKAEGIPAGEMNEFSMSAEQVRGNKVQVKAPGMGMSDTKTMDTKGKMKSQSAGYVGATNINAA